MDPISTAIIAAISAGISKIGTQAVADAYASLKTLLKKKYGDHSEVIKSIESVETKPDSQARKSVLEEEIITIKADQNPDILQAAQHLLAQISKLPQGEKHMQQAIGNNIAQADRNSTASVNVNQPKEQ